VSRRRAFAAGPQTPAVFIGSFDHRILLAVWLAFAAFVVSTPKFEPVRALAFAAFPLFVVTASRLPIARLLRRLAVLSPFVLLTAAANPFLDRTPVGAFAGAVVTAGMVSAAAIVAKALVTILALLTLEQCISMAGICEALRRLGAPRVFTTQLLLLYRYSFLLADEAAAMLKARDIRSFGRRGRGMRDTANLIGSLLLRSVARSERVHKAMLSRGFDGTLPGPAPEPLRSRDLGFALTALAAFGAIRFLL
jgi:cobalt/nickel transport system permease protein